MKAQKSRWTLWLGIASAFGGAQALAAFPDCPTTPGQAGLETWRDEAYEAMLQQGGVTSFVTSPSQDGVHEAIKRCFPAGVPSCLKRLYDATTPLSNEDYGPQFPTAEKRLPKLFANGGDDRFVIPPNIEKIISGQDSAPGTGETVDYKRWKVVKYKSRSTGGFDLGNVGPGEQSTESLMLIFVPGESFSPPLDFDRWINIGLPSDQGSNRFNPVPQQGIPDPSRYASEGSRLAETMTMLTVRKPAPGRRARILFQNFSRENDYSPHYTGGPSSPGSCQSCHPNGMRAISPLGYFAPGTQVPALTPGTSWMAVNSAQVGSPVPTLPADAQRTVTEMNNIMNTYTQAGPMDWGSTPSGGEERPFVQPHAQGGTIGMMQPGRPRDNAFMDACMNQATTQTYSTIRGITSTYSMNGVAPDRNRVRNAMNCAMCHGTMRGGLNDTLSESEMTFKVLVDRSMPPGAANLTESDRIALLSCLNAEKETNKRAWFTQQNACTSGFTPSSAFGENRCDTERSHAASSSDVIPNSARLSLPAHVVGRAPTSCSPSAISRRQSTVPSPQVNPHGAQTPSAAEIRH